MPPLHCEFDHAVPYGTGGEEHHGPVHTSVDKDMEVNESQEHADTTAREDSVSNSSKNCSDHSIYRKRPITESQRKTATTINHASIASRHLYKLWVKLTLPVVLVVFAVTRSIALMLLASLLPFSIAFLQGVLRMLSYRIRHSGAPVPRAPSHGVVKCTSLKSSHFNPSLQCTPDELETPLRLLLIGDSLAVGVGQSSSSTPIMPEAIAKQLSKEMGGRPVMWTCHGAPGASTGWIIQELERSIENGHFQQQAEMGQEINTIDTDNPSELESSSFDDSSCDSATHQYNEEMQEWYCRLKQQRIQFDPQVLAPFDIAVVLTGSNDLKNACFPFLVQQADSEGVPNGAGDYGNELQRLLPVLNRRMRLRLQTLRESVEAATERVRESVDTVVDRTLGRDSSLRKLPSYKKAATFESEALPKDDCSSTTTCDSDEESTSVHSLDSETTRFVEEETPARCGQPSIFPMVVLPGMPADALPAFDLFPLRHLAIPMIDIMDGHKRNLATHHDGEVLFVPAPSRQDLADYTSKKGVYWEQQEDESAILVAHDIKEEQKRRIEEDLRDYYERRHTSYDCNPPMAKRHFSTISADGIHPNDQGYKFWGRYLGNAIVEEWKQKLEAEIV